VKAAADSSKLTQRDTAAEVAAARAGAPPGDTTPISLLPKRFIPDVPGWLGLSMRFLIPDTTPTGERGPTINGLGIFPFDTAWKHVGRATALTVIGDSGTATVFPDGITGSDGYAGNETVLKIRPSETIAARWIVPQSEHAQVQILPVHDSLSEDRLTRIWSAGGAQIRLKRVNRTSARMVAEFNGHSTARSFSIGINPSADSSMGVGDQTDSVLDLKEGWMVPSVYAALRFGANGPIVMIFSESGYECMNTRVVVFRDSGAEWIEEPHFTGDCTR
jgi:hypothetical protein